MPVLCSILKYSSNGFFVKLLELRALSSVSSFFVFYYYYFVFFTEPLYTQVLPFFVYVRFNVSFKIYNFINYLLDLIFTKQRVTIMLLLLIRIILISKLSNRYLVCFCLIKIFYFKQRNISKRKLT